MFLEELLNQRLEEYVHGNHSQERGQENKHDRDGRDGVQVTHHVSATKQDDCNRGEQETAAIKK